MRCCLIDYVLLSFILSTRFTLGCGGELTRKLLKAYRESRIWTGSVGVHRMIGIFMTLLWSKRVLKTRISILS